MKLSFRCTDASIEPRDGHYLDVEVDEVDIDDVCNDVVNELSISDTLSIIDDEDAVLDEIGIERCMTYFGLVDPEDE